MMPAQGRIQACSLRAIAALLQHRCVMQSCAQEYVKRHPMMNSFQVVRHSLYWYCILWQLLLEMILRPIF